jgi:hypothetical protein
MPAQLVRLTPELTRYDDMKPPFEKPPTNTAESKNLCGEAESRFSTSRSTSNTSSTCPSFAAPQQLGALKERPIPSGATSPKPRRSAASLNLLISNSATQPKQWMRTTNGKRWPSVHAECAGRRSTASRSLNAYRCEKPQSLAIATMSRTMRRNWAAHRCGSRMISRRTASQMVLRLRSEHTQTTYADGALTVIWTVDRVCYYVVVSHRVCPPSDRVPALGGLVRERRTVNEARCGGSAPAPARGTRHRQPARDRLSGYGNTHNEHTPV